MSKGRDRRIATVRGLSAPGGRGILTYGPFHFPCTLSRSGRRTRKREGDGTTPIGLWPLRGIRYRADRVSRPRTPLPVTPLLPNHAWCDDPADPNYNRPVPWTNQTSAEQLWREDHLYDIVAVLGYNDRPRIRGRGSAIFLHVAAPDLSPTGGCVALPLGDLIRLLEVPSPPLAINVRP